MKIFIKILTLALFLQTNSCAWFTSPSVPLFSMLKIKVPEGTPAFKMGYEHGCSNVMYSRGPVLYRNMRKYQYDPKMIGNPEYRLGISRGYTFCFQTIVSPANSTASFDRYLNPSGAAWGYGVFDTKAGNINDAWGGLFLTPAPSLINIPDAGVDGNFNLLSGGAGGGALSTNPLWAGGSSGQFFGQ